PGHRARVHPTSSSLKVLPGRAEVPARKGPPDPEHPTPRRQVCTHDGRTNHRRGCVMNRKTWDQLISGAGLVVAIVLVVLGGLAVYGGNFGRDNVRDRLQPELVQFPPYDAMTPEEQATVGQFAGQQVTTGPQAEAFARFIAGHLALVNDGKTYAQTSAAAPADGPDPP